VYRYGGEEFVVLLPQQTSAEAAVAMERVRAAVEALGIPQPSSPSGVLTISVGIAELASDDMTPEAWLRRADTALYRAKHEGRNRVALVAREPHAAST
jgi:diguanylate cyclase (GGDEF)-like protein